MVECIAGHAINFRHTPKLMSECPSDGHHWDKWLLDGWNNDFVICILEVLAFEGGSPYCETC